jgi:hypothetical protein
MVVMLRCVHELCFTAELSARSWLSDNINIADQITSQRILFVEIPQSNGLECEIVQVYLLVSNDTM